MHHLSYSLISTCVSTSQFCNTVNNVFPFTYAQRQAPVFSNESQKSNFSFLFHSGAIDKQETSKKTFDTTVYELALYSHVSWSALIAPIADAYCILELLFRCHRPVWYAVGGRHREHKLLLHFDQQYPSSFLHPYSHPTC